jgi:CRP/FNR family transcriptional regulator, cyclic AMP receptor protein
MLHKWWGYKSVASVSEIEPDPAGPPLTDIDHTLAVDLLCRARSILAMTPKEAELAVGFMVARQYEVGAQVFRDGDASDSTFMLWILQGEATIETAASNPRDAITMTVMEPGSTLGEMGLMDGSRRSANCTACSTLRCAMLTRRGLQQLTSRHPDVAAKLMAIICMGLSNRLRDVTEKFKRHMRVSNIMLERHREAMPNICSTTE